MCYSLLEVRLNNIQDEVDYVVVSYLGIGIESIDMILVFLNSTCLFEISDLVKSPVWHVVVAIELPNGFLDVFTSIEPMLVAFPPFQCVSFCT